MVTIMNSERSYSFSGLSTDTKPIGSNCTNKTEEYPINSGSTYFEINTSKVYILSITSTTVEGVTTYTGSWVEI